MIISTAVVIWFFISHAVTNERLPSLEVKMKEEKFEGRKWWSHFLSNVRKSSPSRARGFAVQRLGTLKQVTMLTYNIWFIGFEMEARMRGIGKIVNELRPNIITLNEVTLDNLRLLESQSWYQRYTIVPTDLKRQEAYFVAVLTNLPIRSWKAYPFLSFDMGWTLLTASLQIPVSTDSTGDKYGKNNATVSLTVGTSHFESLAANTLIRERQLDKSLNILSPYGNACLMGDLNLEEKVDGKVVLPKPWIDAWLSLPGNSHENGYTYDPNINKMIPQGEYTKDRFDRVYCKLENFRIQSMSIVGKKHLAPGVFPSDHFGIFTVLTPSTDTLDNTVTAKNTIGKESVFFKRPLNWKNFLKI